MPTKYVGVYVFFVFGFTAALFTVVYRIVNAVQSHPTAAFKYAIFFAAIVLPFAYTMGADYWPDNHDHLAFKYRLVAYIQHFYQWDFLPYWSTADAYGVGAPTPLYYHKLFYWISASFYMVFGSIKQSTLFGLIFLAGAGVAGMYRSLRLLELPPWPSLLLASAYTFQFYTVTDWFIRGAMAEYGALMLTPWLLWWGLRLLKTGVFSYWLAAILTLTFFAHNVIAYFGMFVLLTATLLHAIKTKWHRSVMVYLLKRGLTCVLVFIGLVAVYAVPMLILSKHYDPSKITWDMSWTFRPLKEYFWDAHYTWNTFEGFTVSLMPMLWVSVLVTLTACVVSWYRKEASVAYINSNLYSAAFVVVCFIFFFTLQSDLTLGFYDHFPGAQFIQFPWRLLTFIQPLVLLGLGLLIASYASVPKHADSVNWISAFFLLGVTASYPVFKNPSPVYGWYHKGNIESLESEGVFGTSGEYMPDVDSLPKGTHIFFLEQAAAGPKMIPSGSATLERLPMDNPESLTQRYDIHSKRDATAVLPVNFSGLEIVSVGRSPETMRRVKPYRTPGDPRVHVDVTAGYHRVTVVLPNVWNLLIR